MTSDTESMGDVIPAVKSFLPDTMLAEAVTHPAVSYCFPQAISYMGKGPSLIASETVPRSPSQY